MVEMSKVIVILVMAEEKWEEADFLKRQIELRGHKAVIMDIGLIGEAQGECDITSRDIIMASGRDPGRNSIIIRPGASVCL